MTSHDQLFWILAAVQCLGVATCLITRLVETTKAAPSCRKIFAVSLASVGFATMAAMYLGSIYWIPCGATLSIISVGATIDFGGRFEPSPF